MNFGRKLRKLRGEKGITQQQLAEKLGYVTNSYMSEVEKGKFIPSKEKLRKIAKALRVPFKELDDLLLESKIEQLGIKEPELVSLFQDVPKLPKRDKKAIIKVYLQIKEKLKNHEMDKLKTRGKINSLFNSR
ncbi:MAG: helix-turn-helix transcriptional regulator [Methanocellales archaeon]|nr:helix-turn-helix transcriptional regulator [Methanocellales archaeon]MDD3292110.1 helix-turn-helix transcriptional regulator [Methanocellales archaeon]MDD5235347.1 helix-turn-helix transcriptional regulator [Methanocellales archaeon]MDD5485705.1 helix-turn-helix transcriptional regulator [Methanocellales archaeon]